MVTTYFILFIKDSISKEEELFSVTFLILLISLSNQFSTKIGSSLIFDFISSNSLILLFLTSSTLEKEIERAVSINFEVKFILLTSSFYIIPNKNLNNRIKIIIPTTMDIIDQIINKHYITNDLKLVKDFYDFLDNNNYRVNYPYYNLMRN
jgi:hypothetical protein